MENNFMLTDELLWDYADGFLAVEAKTQVENWIRTHPDAQQRLDQIMAEKRAFSGLTLEKPDSDFAKKVMGAWVAEHAPAKRASKASHKDWIFWGASGILVALMFVPFLLAPDAPPSEPVRIPEQFIPQVSVPTYDWAGLLSSSSLQFLLMATLALLSLKLLDKYLQVKQLQAAGH
jgi:anti-sigma factor RsiW